MRLPWQVFALTSVVTAAVFNLVGRLLMKDDKSDPLAYSAIFQIGLGLAALFFTLTLQKFSWPTADDFLIRFAISIVLWTLSTVFFLSAFKHIGAAEVTILGCSGSLVAIILGILFLHEPVSLKLLVGIILILGAIRIVTTEKLSFTSRKGMSYALLSSGLSGISVVNDAIILKTYEAFSYTTLISFLPGIVLLVLFPKRLLKMIAIIDLKFIWRMMALCLLCAVQTISYFLAFTAGAPVSQITPISRASVVLTVILAAIFINEKKHLIRKIVAALIMIIGVYYLK